MLIVVVATLNTKHGIIGVRTASCANNTCASINELKYVLAENDCTGFDPDVASGKVRISSNCKINGFPVPAMREKQCVANEMACSQAQSMDRSANSDNQNYRRSDIVGDYDDHDGREQYPKRLDCSDRASKPTIVHVGFGHVVTMAVSKMNGLLWHWLLMSKVRCGVGNVRWPQGSKMTEGDDGGTADLFPSAKKMSGMCWMWCL